MKCWLCQREDPSLGPKHILKSRAWWHVTKHQYWVGQTGKTMGSYWPCPGEFRVQWVVLSQNQNPKARLDGEGWLSSWEQLMLWQRTQVHFQHPHHTPPHFQHTFSLKTAWNIPVLGGWLLSLDLCGLLHACGARPHPQACTSYKRIDE